MELVRSAHSLGEANFHLQFTPKYRCDVFRDGEVKRICEEGSAKRRPDMASRFTP